MPIPLPFPNASAAALSAICALALSVLPQAVRAEGVFLPVLKTTLPASWDEGWFGSPVALDLLRPACCWPLPVKVPNMTGTLS